jgi:hypothetical protein
VAVTEDEPTEAAGEKQPQWKSDGELRATPFRIREESHLLSNSAGVNWKAETREGRCSLKVKVASAPETKLDPKFDREFAVQLGEKLVLKAQCRFIISENNAIEAWVGFQNPNKKKMFGQFYVAFFDKFGNLVGSNAKDFSIEPNGTYPGMTVTDAGPFRVNSSPFDLLKPMPIPRGLEKTIASYKCTLYESESPIGEVAVAR